MLIRSSLFVFFAFLTLWMFANVIHLASGQGLTMAFAATGYASSASAPDAAPSASAVAARETSLPRTPSASGAGNGGTGFPRLVLPRDIGMLSTLFAFCGALGATLHAMGSLVAFAGNGRFSDSWVYWYLAQPLRGGVLAAGFFWLLQGGLLGGIGRDESPVNSLAMMGATFLVGLFSDPAIEKLREVFQVLFRTADKPRRDTLSGVRRPVISGVTFDAAHPPIMSITGTGFDATDKVLINAESMPIAAGSTDTSLQVSLTAAVGSSGTALRVVVLPTQANAEASNVIGTKVP